MSSAIIDPATGVGAVTLRVADLARVGDFYQRAIGLHLLEREHGRVVLGAAPGVPLVELSGDPSAPPPPRRSTGLFHLALLVPGRAELAAALRRVLAAGAGFTGAADHLVSEALYLDDPEGNGIEIYRDRPREEWIPDADGPKMDTLPLDIQGVMAQMPPEGVDEGLPATARMGHVHLRVHDIPAVEAFYVGVLGFTATARGYPGALFVAAGGYHHHLGLNVWAGPGAPPPPEGARGLVAARIVLPDAAALAAAAERLAGAGVPFARDDERLRLADPSGNGLVLAVA